MKKIIAILLALVMMLSFVACSNPEAPSTDDTTTDPNGKTEETPIDKIAGPFEKLMLALSNKNVTNVLDAFAEKGGKIDYKLALGEEYGNAKLSGTYMGVGDAGSFNLSLEAANQQVGLQGFFGANEYAFTSSELTNGVWYGVSYEDLESKLENSPMLAPGSEYEIPESVKSVIEQVLNMLKDMTSTESAEAAAKAFGGLLDKIVAYFEEKATEKEVTLSFRGEEFTATEYGLEFTQADVAAILLIVKNEYAQNADFKAAVDGLVEKLAGLSFGGMTDTPNEELMPATTSEEDAEAFDFNAMLDEAVESLQEVNFKLGFTYSVVDDIAVEFAMHIETKETYASCSNEMKADIVYSFGKTPSFDTGMDINISVFTKTEDTQFPEYNYEGTSGMKISVKAETNTDTAYRWVAGLEFFGDDVDDSAPASMSLVVDLNRETNVYTVSFKRENDTIFAIEGKYAYTENTLDFSISKITVLVEGYDWDEEAEEYVEYSQTMTFELDFSVKIDASVNAVIRKPEYKDILTMTEEEFTQFIAMLEENASAIFGGTRTPEEFPQD